MTDKAYNELLRENAELIAENISLRTRLMQEQARADRKSRLLSEALLFGAPQTDDHGRIIGWIADEEWMTRVEIEEGPIDQAEEDER